MIQSRRWRWANWLYFMRLRLRHVEILCLIALLLPSCAVEPDPDPAYFRTIAEASGYEHSGNIAEAERLHRRALEEIRDSKTAPDQHLAFQMSNLGRLLTENGQPEEGLTVLLSALEILEGTPNADGHLAAVSINIGRALMKQDRLDESEAAYLRALDLTNGNPEWPHHVYAAIFAGLSMVTLQKGEVVKADAYFEKAVVHAPQDLESKDRMAWDRFVNEYLELRQSDC